MRRCTLNFSMYSDMSMRTIARSSSKSASASALVSSVLPTPVGPRNKKLPMGLSGSERPLRLRLMAPATACTASSSMQGVLETDELGHLTFHHLAHGHARPAAHDIGDVLGGNFLLEDTVIILGRLEHGRCLLELRLELRNPAKANLGCRHEVTLARATILVILRLVYLRLDLAYAVDGVLLVGPLGTQFVELLLLLGNLATQLLEPLLGKLVVLLHERLLLDLHLREHAVE